MNASQPGRGGVIYIAFASVLFALFAVLVRTLSGKLPAAEVVVVRFALSLLAMVVWFGAKRKPPSLTHPGTLFLRGLFGGVGVASYFYAIEQLGAGPATMLNYLAPCWAAVFASLFLKERAGRFAWLGLAIATVGGALVTLAAREQHRPLHFGLASGLGLLAGVSSGAAMTTLKKLRDDTDIASIFVSLNVVGLAIAAPFAWKSWTPVEPGLWPVLIAIALLSIAAQLIYSWALAFTPVARGSLATQLTPLFAALFSALLLGEVPTALGVAGGVLCIGGVLLGLVRA